MNGEERFKNWITTEIGFLNSENDEMMERLHHYRKAKKDVLNGSCLVDDFNTLLTNFNIYSINDRFYGEDLMFADDKPVHYHDGLFAQTDRYIQEDYFDLEKNIKLISENLNNKEVIVLFNKAKFKEFDLKKYKNLKIHYMQSYLVEDDSYLIMIIANDFILKNSCFFSIKEIGYDIMLDLTHKKDCIKHIDFSNETKH